MTVLLKNNAVGFLAAAISSSDTSASLTSGGGANFPTIGSGDYFYATLAPTAGNTEIVKVTARSGDTLSIVRAQEGTAALAFAAGSRVELRVTAQAVIDAIEDRVSAKDQASEIGFTPYANISATNVQAAIQEEITDLAASGGAALIGYAPAGTLVATTVQGAISEIVSDLAASGGSALVGFLQGGSGAVARTMQAKQRDVISVKDFGATGDGTTDDTAAIQAAFAYARTRTNAEVYFPANNISSAYLITAPIVIDRPISVRGDGPNAVTIVASGFSNSQYVFDYNCAAIDVVEQAYIKGLTLRTIPATGSGIRLKNISYVTIKDVRVYGVFNGVVMEGTRCFSNAFEELNAYNVAASTVRWTAGFTGGGHFTFLHCTFSGQDGFVLPPTAGVDSLTLVGCNFEQCVTTSMYIGGSTRGLAVIGCRTEGCNGDDFLINPEPGDRVQGITITGTSFTTDAGASRPIVLGGSGGIVRGFSITGNQVEYAGAGTSFVLLNGEGESGLIAGNYFAQSDTTPTNVRRPGVVVFGNENSSGKCAESWGNADWGVAQGTWVPVDASGAGLTLTGNGRYTKIGRQVFWQAFVQYPATADGSNASVGGLPYTIGGLGGSSEGRAGATVQVSSYGADVGVLHGIASTTSFSFYSQTTAANLTNANLTGKYVYCSGTYTI